MAAKCRICKGVRSQQQVQRMDPTCGEIACKITHCDNHIAKKRKADDKAWRAETVKRKKAAKSKGDWAKEAQQQFNRFIRFRDHAEPCISCQRHHEGQYHAGHFRTVGANPELRFHEHNCHKQCAPCNNHLSGNISNYRPALMLKIGEEELIHLEGPQHAKRYAIKDYERIKIKYKVKADELARRIETESVGV